MTTRKKVHQAFVDLIQEGRDDETKYPALSKVVALSKKRNLPLSDLPDKYPAVLVSLDQELLVQNSGHNTPGFKARTAQVVVKVRAFGEEAEDQANGIADEIERLTDRKNTLSGDVVRQVRLELVKIVQGSEEQPSVTTAEMTFSVNYQSETEEWEKLYEQ